MFVLKIAEVLYLAKTSEHNLTVLLNYPPGSLCAQWRSQPTVIGWAPLYMYYSCQAYTAAVESR